MDREFDVLIEEDETGWFVASVPSLPGCLTQGRSVEQAKERVREAIVAYLAAQPAPAAHLRYVGIERVSIPG